MRVLIVGGNRFVGLLCAERLLAGGHAVTLFNRGSRQDGLGERVERIRGDRMGEEFGRILAGREFDAMIDFAAFTGDDVKRAIEVFSGNVGHYVFISTGQVYLVREGCPKPAKESDYAGKVMDEPADAREREEWLYGVGKRAGEDALAEAFEAKGFPSTRWRIPMVNGERDYYRRIESYLWRIMDGGPVILPDGGNEVCRHVYGEDVARTICEWLGKREVMGKALNLCQEEQPTVAELVGIISEIAGRRTEMMAVSAERLAQKGLRPKDVSPFSTAWMSRLDPGLAKRELGFVHTPLKEYLGRIVAWFRENPPVDRPGNYAHRGVELELARGG